MQVLERHAWRGNVRELANIVERTSIVHPGADISAATVAGLLGVEASHVPVAASTIEDAVATHGGLAEVLDQYERNMIETALRNASGNVAEAARWLNTDRPNLYRRMKRLGIEGSRGVEQPTQPTPS